MWFEDKCCVSTLTNGNSCADSDTFVGCGRTWVAAGGSVAVGFGDRYWEFTGTCSAVYLSRF